MKWLLLHEGRCGEGKWSDEDLGDRFLPMSIPLSMTAKTRFSACGVYRAHEIFGGKTPFSIGKTEPLVFIDSNAFANNEITPSLCGKAFREQSHAWNGVKMRIRSIAAASISPFGALTFTALCAPRRFPMRRTRSKRASGTIFSPRLWWPANWPGLPNLEVRQGNYRNARPDASMSIPFHMGIPKETGWGVGISMDQQVTDMLGLSSLIGRQRGRIRGGMVLVPVANLRYFFLACMYELGIRLAGLKGSGRDPQRRH